VRPLIYLPECKKSLKDKLGVVSVPSNEDLISNIKNVSATCYNDDQLFTNYPSKLKPPSGDNNRVLNLVQILEKNFIAFKQESNISELACCACIPVHTEFDLSDGSQVALVRPNCVLASLDQAKNYHPYLNALPSEFVRLLGLLQKVGITLEINLKHIRIILEKVFLRSDGHPITVNTQEIIQQAIILLNSRLASLGGIDLSPLYLPDTKNIMRLSTALIYKDSCEFRGLRLNLEDSSLYFLHFPYKKFNFLTQEFCNNLPPSVRPQKLSDQCVIVPDRNCECVSHTEIALRFQETFQNESCSLNLAKLISHIMAKQKLEASIAEEIKRMFDCIKIVTMKNLKTQVKLKNSEKIIGEMKSSYALDSTECCLYIDSEGTSKTEDRIASTLANFILGSLSQSQNPTGVNLLEPVKDFLRCSTVEKIKMLVDLEIECVMNENVDIIELGEEIPAIFHDRLDQHVDNIYNPMEFVGYEIGENKIIMAKVIYLKKEGHCSVYNKVYKIYVSDSDKQGLSSS